MFEGFNSLSIWVQISALIVTMLGTGGVAKIYSDWLVHNRDGANSLRGDLMKRILQLEDRVDKQNDDIASLREENGRLSSEVLHLRSEVERLEKLNKAQERKLKKEEKD